MKALYRDVGLDDHAPVIRLDEKVTLPELEDNGIQIRVKACGLSLPSNKVLNELFHKSPQLQYPVGHEVAGVITEIGAAVTSLAKGDKVVGIVPLHLLCSGCAEMCQLGEYDVVKIPGELSFVKAAASIGDGLKVYMGLHYQGRLCGGDTILIMDGASSWGTLAIQMAQQWGAKVVATVSSQDERVYLEEKYPQLAQIIDLSTKNSILLSAVMEETGGIGVDIVLDNGVSMFTQEEDVKIVREDLGFPKPSKRDIISVLAVGGHWVTSQDNLQIDPPDSRELFLKGASVHFLFEHAWTLSSSQHGRYQHILGDLMEKLANRSLQTSTTKTVSLENAVDVLKTLQAQRIGKVVAAF